MNDNDTHKVRMFISIYRCIRTILVLGAWLSLFYSIYLYTADADYAFISGMAFLATALSVIHLFIHWIYRKYYNAWNEQLNESKSF